MVLTDLYANLCANIQSRMLHTYKQTHHTPTLALQNSGKSLGKSSTVSKICAIKKNRLSIVKYNYSSLFWLDLEI